jgi:hypothetical protein
VQGIQRGSGKTIVPVGATMNITFGYLLRTLEIAGTVTHSGVLGDRILLGNAQSVNGTIHVLPGGVFNLVGPVGITPAGGGGAQLLHNEGTITRTGADSSGIGGDGFSFDNAGTVDVQAGTLNLGVITLTNTGTLRAAGGATLNLGNTTTLLAAGSIDGAGDVVFAGPAQWSGGTMTGTGRSIVETTGGLNLTGGGLRSSSREIDVRGFVAMQPGGALVLRTPALAIAPGAYLDVNDNALIVDYTGGTPQANIRAALTSGYNGGSWNGTGIRSSAAATTTTRALGYAEASAIFSNFPATFLGQQVDNTAVLVRYTRYGDADLSGNVNLNDFNRLATSFGQASTAWTQGNFNYDGFTNLNDFNLLAANFGQAAGPDGGVGGLERLRNMLPDEEADVFDEALA